MISDGDAVKVGTANGMTFNVAVTKTSRFTRRPIAVLIWDDGTYIRNLGRVKDLREAVDKALIVVERQRRIESFTISYEPAYRATATDADGSVGYAAIPDEGNH